ncbi:MAG: hypothetical protein CMB62_00385 [Euryarchaeota archaeon]|nr:hypothetical protein [Euryarchaeota archaeon]|tara:strand:- start:2793 stop:3449 length:657 start_codon:yes stop_codon:yes gene_type:complete
MEEPELRIGGWVQEKKRGKIRRVFSFLLIVIIGLLIGGPILVDYNDAIDVQDNSLYKSTGSWNGPFDQENIKEFNGHLKISKKTYESSDGYSGKLIILSLSSLISLDLLNNKQNIIVNKAIAEMDKEELKYENGKILTEINEKLPAGTEIYQWEATPNENANGFFSENKDGKIFVKTFSWTNKCTNAALCNPETVICIAFGTNLNIINQATELIENVG